MEKFGTNVDVDRACDAIKENPDHYELKQSFCVPRNMCFCQY